MPIYLSAFSGFSVDDLVKAKQFYGSVLGLSVKEEKEMGLWLELPNDARVFIYPKPNHEPATYTILNLVVENIDRTMEELQGKGVMFEVYDNDETPQDEKGIVRGLDAGMGPDIAWFRDPAGNIVSVLQEK